MNIAWIAESEYVLPVTVDVDQLKAVGPIWSGHKAWRSCSTDNVVCHDFNLCQQLIDRNFQTKCNFYINKNHFVDLGRPNGVNLYSNTGSFDLAVDNVEDIISMHLASANAEIILLLGFDFSTPASVGDQFEQHKIRNRHGMIYSVIAQNPQTQWVAVNHSTDFDLKYSELSNLSSDKMKNVLKLLA